MPRGVPIPPEKEARIIARLLVERHASLVAREEGVSFAKLADRECIELTAGREAKGYWRLSPDPGATARLGAKMWHQAGSGLIKLCFREKLFAKTIAHIWFGGTMATIPMIPVGPVTTLNRSILLTERAMSGTGADDLFVVTADM
jgi:hypothetical protein